MEFTPIQQRLDSIKRSPVDQAEKVAEEVLDHPHLTAEIIDCVESEDSALQSRAARVLEIVAAQSPDIVQPFKDKILHDLSWTDQWHVRAHFCKVIPILDLSREDVEKAYQIFDHYLSDRSSIVRTFAMQGMFDLLDRAPERTESVRKLIEELMETGTPAMLSRGRMLLVAFE